MKIKLEYPFNESWRLGYLVTNKEPRRNVVLFNSHKDRTTISYARYLMSVKLGRLLGKDEIVDHINGDKMDDRLDNYQIITMQENIVKGNVQNKSSRVVVKLKCGVCVGVFSIKTEIKHIL